jgi:hypothetical protein
MSHVRRWRGKINMMVLLRVSKEMSRRTSGKSKTVWGFHVFTEGKSLKMFISKPDIFLDQISL